MRNLKEVITNIINILDRNGQGESGLVKDLYAVYRDVDFTAPELIYIRWNAVYGLLCDYLLNDKELIPNDEDTEFVLDIFALFSAKPKEELRKVAVDKGGK